MFTLELLLLTCSHKHNKVPVIIIKYFVSIIHYMIDHHHSTTNLIIDRSSSLIKPLTLKFTVIIIIINNGWLQFWFIHIPTYLIVGFEEYEYQKELYGFLSLQSWERFMSIFSWMNEHKRLKHTIQQVNKFVQEHHQLNLIIKPSHDGSLSNYVVLFVYWYIKIIWTLCLRLLSDDLWELLIDWLWEWTFLFLLSTRIIQ